MHIHKIYTVLSVVTAVLLSDLLSLQSQAAPPHRGADSHRPLPHTDACKLEYEKKKKKNGELGLKDTQHQQHPTVQI